MLWVAPYSVVMRPAPAFSACREAGSRRWYLPKRGTVSFVETGAGRGMVVPFFVGAEVPLRAIIEVNTGKTE